MSDSDAEEKGRIADLEKEGVEGRMPTLVTKDHVAQDPLARAKMLMWMAINTLATVFIVSCPLPGIVPNGFDTRRPLV